VWKQAKKAQCVWKQNREGFKTNEDPLHFHHMVETESAPSNLQMQLVELKNNEQLAKKFKEKFAGHVESFS